MVILDTEPAQIGSLASERVDLQAAQVDESVRTPQSLSKARMTREQMTLPGGGELGCYQPRHARPKAMKSPAAKAPAKRVTKKAAKKRKV
ncbi:MAG: hypothetical protein ACRD8O_15465 [Bryobacteraceae bacterium]